MGRGESGVMESRREGRWDLKKMDGSTLGLDTSHDDIPLPLHAVTFAANRGPTLASIQDPTDIRTGSTWTSQSRKGNGEKARHD